MTTNQALKEYEEFLQSILDQHSSALSLESVQINSNTKKEKLDQFFSDYDARSDRKAKHILEGFTALGDKTVLIDSFLILTREYNEKFKSFVRDFENDTSAEPEWILR